MTWRDRVTLEVGDIAQADTEAVVNAANNELWMGSGVAGALKRAGGDVIEREAVAQGPIAVGEAVLTSGGELPALYVLHAAAMAPGRPATAASVQAAVESALRLAAEQEIESVSLPALGTGVGALDFASCARGTFHAIAAHCARQSQPEEIRIVLFGENALQAFEAVLDEWDKPQPDIAGLGDAPV
jgi:O-acetyl-ADP-ribose deacetylase (regulator of RNase III)